MTTISSAAEQAPAAAPLVGRADVNRKRMARLGWFFTAPALIVVAAVTIFPIIYSVVMSLSNVTVTGNGISLNGFTTSNYSLVLKNATWHYALFFTIIYTFITVLVELVLGTLIALVLERLAGGRGWMMALLLLPWSMITVIIDQGSSSRAIIHPRPPASRSSTSAIKVPSTSSTRTVMNV